MEDNHLPHPDDDTVTALEKLLEGIMAGRITTATIKLALKDGTTETYHFGYSTDEERDAALAKLLRVLGELH